MPSLTKYIQNYGRQGNLMTNFNYATLSINKIQKGNGRKLASSLSKESDPGITKNYSYCNSCSGLYGPASHLYQIWNQENSSEKPEPFLEKPFPNFTNADCPSNPRMSTCKKYQGNTTSINLITYTEERWIKFYKCNFSPQKLLQLKWGFIKTRKQWLTHLMTKLLFWHCWWSLVWRYINTICDYHLPILWKI